MKSRKKTASSILSKGEIGIVTKI